MPTTWGDWASLVGIMLGIGGVLSGIVLWIARQLHRDITSRIDQTTKQLTEITAWQTHLEETHLPSTYARKDLMEIHLKTAEESNQRVERLVREIKTEMIAATSSIENRLKESMHALRTDLLVLVKKDLEK